PFPPHTTLIGNAFSVFITEPYFIHRIAVTLFGPFTKINGFQTTAGNTSQCVTHLKKEIDLFVTDRDQITTKTRFPLIGNSLHVHFCLSGSNPNKFPVELQVLYQLFACLDGFVLCRTLRSSCHYSKPTTQ